MQTFHNADDLRARGFQLLVPPVAIASFDPAGSGVDRDALVVVSREEHQRGEPQDPDFAVEFIFRVLLAHRLPKEWEFPDKMAAILNLDGVLKRWTRQRRQSAHVLTVETNGVGYGYASSLARKTDTRVLGYATVGTVNTANYTPPDGAKFAMPRLKALDNLRILIETGYLKVAPNAPGIRDLETELNAFVWRGQNRPEAMEGQNDDLVMALTGATWVGSKVLPPVLKQVKVPGATRRASGTRVRLN